MQIFSLKSRIALKATGLLFLFNVFISCFLSGCFVPEIKDPAFLHGLNRRGFEKKYVNANGFKLLTLRKISNPNEPVRIYIEGDGRAWISRRRFSDDPTPREPIALYLAAEDPSANVAYIARPGQFPESGSTECEPVYWSTRRFSPEVIDAMSEAINGIKLDVGADRVELVGYSGGAAITVLVAAKRDDVKGLITVAGNLDHEALSAYHKTSPLEGSLNAVDYAVSVKNIPQRHFAGEKDKVVPVFIIRRFAEASGDVYCRSVIVVKRCGHNDGWVETWHDIAVDKLSNPVKAF